MSWRLTRRGMVALVVMLVALGFGARVADADVQVRQVNFDNVPLGTLTQTDELTFGLTLPDGDQLYRYPTVVQASSLSARSGSQVLSLPSPPGPHVRGAESAVLYRTAYAQFAHPARSVQFFFRGYPDTGASLTLYDAAGDVLAQRSITTSVTDWTPLEVDDPLGELRVAGASFSSSGIVDDLSWVVDEPSGSGGSPPPPPDFTVQLTSGALLDNPTLKLAAGGSADVAVGLHRFNNSQGPINLSVAGLPTGVTARFDSSTADGDGTVLYLKASPNASNTDVANVQIIATPSSPAVGVATRTATLPLSVVGAVDVAIRGIEVTQGIQSEVQPCLTYDPNAPLGDPNAREKWLCSGNVSLPYPTGASRTVAYRGIMLAADRPTYACVHATVLSPGHFVAHDWIVRLRAWRDGKELGSVEAASDLRNSWSGEPWVTTSDRFHPQDCVWLRLPPAWIGAGTIDLEADTAPTYPPNGVAEPAGTPIAGAGRATRSSPGAEAMTSCSTPGSPSRQPTPRSISPTSIPSTGGRPHGPTVSTFIPTRRSPRCSTSCPCRLRASPASRLCTTTISI